MDNAHEKTVDEVLKYFSADQDKGLSPDQIKRNQEKYGPNGECGPILPFHACHWLAGNPLYLSASRWVAPTLFIYLFIY